MDFAGFWVRLFSGVIDAIILSGIVLLMVMGANFAGILEQYEAMLYLVIFIFAVLYEVLLTASSIQATVGKRLLDVYVGSVEGSRISKLRSFMRYIILWISYAIFPIGIISGLMVIFSQEKAGLHDVICKTRAFRGKVYN